MTTLPSNAGISVRQLVKDPGRQVTRGEEQLVDGETGKRKVDLG